MDDRKSKKDRVPPVVQQCEPNQELEEKLRSSPNDRSLKVDVGSDESMDASDPPSVVLPSSDEPVPSSGSPNDSDDDDEGKGGE